MTQETIDMSQLPLPAAVEEIDPELILSLWLADLTGRDPDYDGLLESDPAYIQGEAVSYRESLLRQRINEGVQATFLATAVGDDLDVKAADYGVVRLIITPADPDAVPPVEAEYESNEVLRQRTWLSMQALSVAGPYGAYRYHALSASSDVFDVAVLGPESHELPGEVHIYLLSRTGDGTASAELIDTVQTALNDEDVRPLTDYVRIFSATPVSYGIEAILHIQPGPDAQSVQDAAEEAMQSYSDSRFRIGKTPAISGIYAALQQPGVELVELITPIAEFPVVETTAYYCGSITLSTILASSLHLKESR